jgi:hypothetical protein
MALLERLQILIDADGKGLVREFDKAGTAADKLDAKLEKGAAKTSARLTSIGTKAAIGGAAVIGGLYKLAQASDEAEKQQIKLENSVRNSDRAFSNGGKALTDLAQSLQKVTAADGDAIVGAESLLVQFGLTEAQVKKVTPLVVDLSRKLGIDLDAAAKMVGKSIGGSAGALKKAGIDIDATRLKTDAFGATVDALAGSVGGFARQEGKTFAGQIAILKNNLGDLGETVGKGAAGVFNDLAGGANGALGALNKLNPAIGESVGRVGAVGGIAVTAVGGLAVLAGQFTKLKDAAYNAEGGLTRFGKAAAGIGVAAGVLALYEIIQAFDNAKTQSVQFKAAIGELANAKGPAELGQAFKAAEQEGKSFFDSISSVGLEDLFFDQRLSVEGIDIGLSDVRRTLEDLSKDGNISALSNAIAVLENNTEGSADNMRALEGDIKRYKEQIQKSAGATAAATIAQRDQNKAVEDAVDALDSENATLEGIQKTLAEYEQKVRSLDDAYEAAQAGAKAFGDSIERGTQLDDIAGAAVNLGDKLRTLNEDLAGLPKNFQDAFDPTKITEGSGKAITSLIGVGEAATKQFQALITSGNEGLVPQLAEQYRDILTKALQAAGIPPEQIQQYIGLAGLSDEQIEIALKVTQVEEQLTLVKQRLALFQTDLSKAPQEVRVAIDEALLAGDIAKANALIEEATRPREVKVYVATPQEKQYDTRGVTADRTAQRQGRKRALGGPLAKGQRSLVNEMGAEMFVPSSSGFVMDSDDSKALVRGVEAMLAGGGGHTFNITSSDPVLTAAEVVRRQRDAQFLLGR